MMAHLRQYTIAGLAYLFREVNRDKDSKNFSDIEQELIERDLRFNELLEALKMVEDIFMKQRTYDSGWDSYNEEVLNKIQQAIAKAEGK
jgi:hypothetical protein